ncbi:hypothetical protein ACH4U6_35150 [Streptomyces netropsis]|uniref:hypothetical protein n=1 Tax=Streptomyces netropsis TaxID=55404 RepID=UPI0037B1AC6B
MTSFTTPPATVGRGSIRQVLDQGIHPATRMGLLEPWTTDPSFTCGDCVFLAGRILNDGQTRLKCRLKTQRRRGPDLKPDFPACTAYRAAPGGNGGQPAAD